MTTTWSPQAAWGVKLGLCLPRRMLAMIVARRPTTRPSASIRCHFFSTSCGLADLGVFISAFMARISRGTNPSCVKGERRLTRGGADRGQMAAEGVEVKEKQAFHER